MRKHLWGAVVVLPILLLTLNACVSSDFAAVHTEPDFFYGYGSGPTEAEAKEAAYVDLIYKVLTETASIPQQKKAKFAVTPEERAAFDGFKLDPYVLEKKETAVNSVYRLNRADWAKAETARLAKLSADLGGRFNAAVGSKKSLGDRIADAAKVAVAVDAAGVTLSLHTGAAGSPVLSQAIEQWTRDQLAGLTFLPQPPSGLVKGGQAFKVLVADKAQKPLVGIPVTYLWASDVGTSNAASVVTDATGTATFPVPIEENFKNRQIVLKLATILAPGVPGAGYLASLDGSSKAEFPYRNAEDLSKVQSNQVRVAGGTFTVGKVSQDRRAGGNEKPRTVTVATFAIDRDLVTNAQYLSFLQATNVPKESWPDYIESPDNGAPAQPVIGITLAQAQQYAAWLSGVLGQKLRLPTEDEYEVAARAGQLTIFPWGDQAPTDGVRADYAGNKKFATTAPVGSFDNGKNAWGLDDMVGNVWEWTTTSPDENMSADPSYKIVKGGSWLDGPNELRISNRRAVDPGVGTSDIGFRLVREDIQ